MSSSKGIKFRPSEAIAHLHLASRGNVRSQSYQDHIQDRLSDCKFRQV